MSEKRLGPFGIERRLGAGGMGAVYAARLLAPAYGLDAGERVALKVVHAELIASASILARFEREARLGASIRHRNVVRTLGSGEHDGVHYLVMEFVEGQTLTELLRELDPVPEGLCRHVGREVASGLAAIHAVGAVHRDLKPDNVLITPAEEVKIMDLGIAWLVDQETRLSRAGAFVGSVEYAAPEQFGGEEMDARTDLYALGLLLYEIATASHPFRGGRFHEVARRVLDGTPRRAGDANPQLSPFFEELVHTLMVRDPRGRFVSAGQCLDVLAAGEESGWWRLRERALRRDTRRPLRRIRVARATRVFGREDEIAKLHAAYRAATARDGSVVLIEGEAGVGKSRLVDELVARLEAEGGDLAFLSGGSPPHGAGSPGGGILSALREQLGDDDVASRLPDSPLLAPAFEALLRGRPMPDGQAPLSDDALAACCVQVVRSLAGERTVVLLVEDLHFASVASRELFAAIACAAPGHRIVLLGTLRPGTDAAWRARLARAEHVHVLPLEPLMPAAIESLLQAALGDGHAARVAARRLTKRCDGNPFVAFELAGAVRDAGLDRDGAGRPEDLDELAMPSTLRDVVAARLARLDEEDRDLIDLAACCGHEFDPSLVGEVAGLARLPLLKRLGRIERDLGLVRSVGRHLRFDHHHVHEVIVSSLPPLLREALHASIADVLASRGVAEGDASVALVDHALHGRRGDLARGLVDLAVRHLHATWRPEEAVSLAERALSLDGLLIGPERARVLVRIATSRGPLDRLGRRERQESAAREAVALAQAGDDVAARADAALALGVALWRGSRYDEADEHMRHALEAAEAIPDARRIAIATGALGANAGNRGDLEAARSHHERALSAHRSAEHRRGEATALGNLAWVANRRGELDASRSLRMRQLAVVDELTGEEDPGAVEQRAEARLALAGLDYAAGSFDAAREGVARGREDARQIGARALEASALANLATLDIAAGRLEPALRSATAAIDLARDTGRRPSEANALSTRATALWHLGRYDECEEAYEAALGIAREIGHRTTEALALLNQGLVRRVRGQAADADQLLRESLSVCRSSGLRGTEAHALLAIGSLRAAAGDVDAARSVLERAESLGTDLGLPDVVTGATCALATLPGGDPARAAAVYAEHADRLHDAQRLEPLRDLWRATGERSHLTSARRVLDTMIARVPAATRASLRTENGLHREILAATSPGTMQDDDEQVTRVSEATGDDRATESPTRPGE